MGETHATSGYGRQSGDICGTTLVDEPDRLRLGSFAQYQSQFTGDYFDTFWRGDAPDCATPVAPNPYMTSSRVVATLNQAMDHSGRGWRKRRGPQTEKLLTDSDAILS